MAFISDITVSMRTDILFNRSPLMRSTILMLLGLTLAAGCSSSVVHEKEDPFYQGKIQYSGPIVLTNMRYDLSNSGYLALIFERVQASEASPTFDIKVRCGAHHGKLMDIPEGDSLIITADGHGVRYASSAGSAGGRPAPGARRPEAPYILYEGMTLDDLQALAKAQNITVRVTGADHSIIGEFSHSNKEALREFMRGIPNH
jgi:hypothetical protein